jgi:multidrug efflux pump
MNISELSLKRPVLALVMNIIIVVFGVIGYNFLGIRDYPAIDPPNISVRTSYSGANADIIESQITEPLEKSINGIAGIKNISSNSSQGTSSINIEFDLGVDLEAAANDVRDKVSQAARQLPRDLDSPPEVSKADATTDFIISVSVQSISRNQLELTEYANNVLVERFQTIPGVSSIRIMGEQKYAMRIWLDPSRLSAYGLTSLDVQQALTKQNVELPAGKISGESTDLSVRTFGKLFTEEDFNNVRIKSSPEGTIRLRDVGEAVLGPENEEIVLKGRLVPMVGVAINPLPGANYVEIADEFYKRLEQINKDLPKDIKLTVATDQTVFIKRAISEVKETLIISFLLVVLIVYLFFRDFIIAIRPLIDIPVSLIATFFIMYLFDFSINVLTMLGIVLATGLVVDDGIVVTENIYKKLEGGMNKFDAAREGSKEIFFAVIATSITLAVVFLPIVFLQGFVGRLFREFGFVVAGAVLISCFVSLTLTPVLSVKLTRDHKKKSRFYKVTERFFTGMESGYRNSLTRFMKVRWLAFVIVAACLGSSYFFMQNLQSELAPLEDRNQFRLQVSAPEGTSFTYMVPYIDGITTFLMDSIPESRIIYSLTGGSGGGMGGANSGMVRVFLNDPSERSRTQQDVVNMVNRNLPRFSAGKVFAAQEQTISTSRRPGQPVQFVIQNNNFEKLKEALPKFLDAASDHPVLQGADVDLKFNKPELRMDTDEADSRCADDLFAVRHKWTTQLRGNITAAYAHGVATTALDVEILRAFYKGLAARDVPLQRYPTTGTRYLLFFDGGSRGNPGPGGSGSVMIRLGGTPQLVWAASMSYAQRTTTNNFAEYQGLCTGLGAAAQHGWHPLDVVGDSMMIIRQLTKRRPPKVPGLRDLYERARTIADGIRVRGWHHHYRSHNKMADKAANQAMDSGSSYQAHAVDNRKDHVEIQEWLLNDVHHWLSNNAQPSSD